MEEELYREYKKLRKQGFKVKGFWFKARAKQILQRMNPDATFLFSDAWFDGFKLRHRISLRRPINVWQLTKERRSSSSIEQSERLLMKRYQQDQLGVSHHDKLPMSIRHLCHSPSLAVEPTQILVTRQCGFGVLLLVWTRGNVQPRSRYLPMVNRG